MMVITLKHAEAVLMQILILLLKQFSRASVGNKTLIISRCTVRLWKKRKKEYKTPFQLEFKDYLKNVPTHFTKYVVATTY
jgi:hypothetical protein